ncbi:TlpA family protein disulfide reductase [Zunongwangia sp. HGR-M22]|uniref:TlpA family protein disulfide reductase n=1 Tax=Zunongwangia sp. HGR-M22 TaxID=3015168 RepID=UPI0022DE5486|nr:TlpA disulfide reductase family protein [Zunongwangia sp. HGR-M22]WBL24342.1 TlpA disulfide reductase family protein [Zunongwangia sp. HGR-M22]
MKLTKTLRVLPTILVVLLCSISTINCKGQSNSDDQQEGHTVTLSASNASKKDTILNGITLPVIAGHTLHFTYTPKEDLQDIQNIQGLAYTFENFEWNIKDIDMKKVDGDWECSFKVPDNCGFFAFKFYASTDDGLITDTNNDAGYMYTPISSKNEKIPGSSLAWGLFRNKNFNSNFGNYFEDFSASDEASEFWLKKEVQDNPDQLPKFIDTYIHILKVRKPEKFEEIASSILQNFSRNFKDISEKQLVTLKNIYQFELKNTKVSDSINKVLEQRYPKGIEMRSQAFMNANQQGNDGNRYHKLEQFLKNYPSNESVPQNQQFFYNKTYSSLFEHYFLEEKYDKALNLIPEMNFVSINDSYHFTISKAYHFKSVSTENLLKLSTPMIAQLKEKIEDLSYMSGLYWSPNQATENAKNQLDRKLKVHIRILNELGAYENALNAFSHLSKNELYKNSDLNELHIHILQELNKDIKPVLIAAAKANALTPNLTYLLEEEYRKEPQANSNFDTYLSNLKSSNQSTVTSVELISLESPVLVFEDSSGESKIIEGEKDEIIILDFWANWCAPCKKAFPTMYSLDKSYSEDKSVAFYFVNTSEYTSGYRNKSIEYFNTNGYSDLNLVFDLQGESGSNNKTFSRFAELFNSSGIPRKVIIKNGEIRYTSEGYSGNPGELRDEINNVIYLLKNE